MQKRQIAFNFKGIAQDAINGSVNSQFAYKITNMRISASKNSNVLQLTTEKGTTGLRIDQASDELEDGIYLGHCVVGNYVVLFITSEHGDFIYRLDFKNHDVDAECRNELIFHGNLNFNENHRIESIGIYENENIQKVYWIDGLNQPRVINVVNNYGDFPLSDVYNKFDFLVQSLYYNTTNEIDVTRSTGGRFNSGTIQYCYSLYNLNNQETPILCVSPLNYISHSDRGANINEVVNCSFNVKIDCNIQGFEYLRLYSIYRSSENGSPLVRVVADVKKVQSHIEILDNGLGGYDVDPSVVKYVIDNIVPQCISCKDNTLFFGNYSTGDIINTTSLYKHQDILDIQNDVRNTNVYAYNANDAGFYLYNNQLSNSSQDIKTFKYLEYYKLGVQFQDIYGNWSQPYFIKDQQNYMFPTINSNGQYILPRFGINVSEIYNLLSDDERSKYVNIRPVVSLPNESERSILCQGVLNPTVFNITERKNKTCYAYSSWFFRPFKPRGFQHDSNSTYHASDAGAFVNYNHYDALNSSMDIGGEIQGMYFDSSNKYNTENDIELTRPYLSIEDQNFDIEKYTNFYYVDQNIVTLNSPDIQFDDNIKNIDLSNYKLRVIGVAELDSFAGKYNIISENPQFFNDLYSYRRRPGMGFFDIEMYIRGDKLPYGFYDKPLIKNYDQYEDASGILCAQNCWFDEISDLTKDNNQTIGDSWNYGCRQTSYYVYPWQRQFLNNYNNGNSQIENVMTDDKYGYYPDSESSKLQVKILSNLRFSLNTKYFSSQNKKHLPTEKILYNINNKINKLSDSKIYYGYNNKSYLYNSEYSGFSLNIGVESQQVPLDINPDVVQGYPITIQDNLQGTYFIDPLDNSDNTDYSNRIDSAKPREFYKNPVGILSGGYDAHHSSNDQGELLSSNNRSTDAIQISYQSDPHIVIKLSQTQDGKIFVLPAFDQQIDGTFANNQYEHTFSNGYHLPWSDTNYDYDVTGYIQYSLNNSGLNLHNKGYLLIGELYQQTDGNSYFNTWDEQHGILTNESNLYTRLWQPCGEVVKLNDSPNNTLYWVEGDTYYQRYDCLKTKPYNDTDYQSIVEIGSFMVETRVNLDGRYDENRGMIDNTKVSEDNFNLLNKTYNQSDNFYSYYILDKKRFNLNTFNTSVIWSGNKIYGEEIDNWTKISPVNKLDLDGNKGSINALRKFRNNIYAFQNSSVSRIRFNDRTALSTVEGLPIQLASADKVDGYEFINEVIGCQNKFSNIETENGIYFIDNNTPGIYKLGYNEYGNINIDNISKQKLMQRWFENNNDRESLTFYDRNINEVLFNINNNSLVFSMDSNYFSQFINYEKAKDVININNISIAVLNEDRSLSLHTLRTGYYSNFFGEYKDYGVDFIACPQIGQDTNGIIRDCIYDNVWYHSDVFDTGNDSFDNNMINTNYLSNETFDEIHVIDTYQNNSSILDFNLTPLSKITTLRKKFMMWYARIPRHKYRMQNKNYDRMRDKFIKISFTKHQTENHKMVLGDIAVDCFY